MKDIPTTYEDLAQPIDHFDASDLAYSGDLPLDAEKYLPYLEDSDITEAQKAELLATLWSIMRAFVELGWGVNSIHNFIPALKEIYLHAGIPVSETQQCSARFNDAAPKGATEGTEQ